MNRYVYYTLSIWALSIQRAHQSPVTNNITIEANNIKHPLLVSVSLCLLYFIQFRNTIHVHLAWWFRIYYTINKKFFSLFLLPHISYSLPFSFWQYYIISLCFRLFHCIEYFHPLWGLCGKTRKYFSELPFFGLNCLMYIVQKPN